MASELPHSAPNTLAWPVVTTMVLVVQVFTVTAPFAVLTHVRLMCIILFKPYNYFPESSYPFFMHEKLRPEVL